GRVVRVIGPVVDVEFPRGGLPELYNALTVEIELEAVARTITLEVAQHLGDNLVRAVSMAPTDGLVRGAAATAPQTPISVPVGDGVKATSVTHWATGWTSQACVAMVSSGESTANHQHSTSSRARLKSSKPVLRSPTC